MPLHKSVSVRLLLTGVAVLGLLAACNRDKPAAPAPRTATATVTPAATPVPFTFDQKTDYAQVSLKLPEALKTQPDFQAKLYADTVQQLKSFAEGAQGDLAEAGSEGINAYDRTVEFSDVVETPRLMSVAETGSEYTGGAHPNPFMAGHLWDKQTKQVVQPLALFKSGADLSALDRALCAAVNIAKKARDPQNEAVTLTGKDGWACPRARETAFVLAPSATPGRAGGLTFLVGPYVVGPYAEGSYEVDVAASAFTALLNPAYANEFGGAIPARP